MRAHSLSAPDRRCRRRSEAERVTLKIDEQFRSPPVGGRLCWHPVPLRLLGFVEVVNDEVQVHLGWRVRIGPGEWLVVTRAQESTLAPTSGPGLVL